MIVWKSHALLIRTDGFEIDTWKFNSVPDAQAEMRQQYESFTPTNGLTEDCAETSFCGDMDATLNVNGEEVFVWKIVSL